MEPRLEKSKMDHPRIVSPAEWLAARKELLKKEKEFSKLRDELSRLRREMPWEKVEKAYTFDGPKGKESLAELFGGRSQLIVYHFMLGPDWKEGCPSCSFISDHIDGSVVHLAARDVRLVVVSRAPLAQIEAFKKRMGWRFHWVSSSVTDFNYDYQVSMTKKELEKGQVYYNYSMQQFPSEERPGTSPQRRVRQHLPYLFELRSRAGHADRGIQLVGPYTKGARRRGAEAWHGVGAAP